MIGVIFDFAGEIIEVRIDNTNCLFRTKQYGGAFSTIDGLKLDKKGVVKEFPDLKDKETWKKEAIERFKERIKNMKNEDERMDYVIKDLGKWGYIPLYKQKKGCRPVKI